LYSQHCNDQLDGDLWEQSFIAAEPGMWVHVDFVVYGICMWSEQF